MPSNNFFSSPSSSNLPILSGAVSWKKTGVTDFSDLGYVEDLSINVSVTKKQKKIPRGGMLTLVKTAITEVAASFKMTMSEVAPDQLSMFVLGDVTTATDGSKSVQMLANADPTGYLKFVADNVFGPQFNFTAYVTLGPAGDLAILSPSGDFGTLPCEGDINPDPITGLYPAFVYPYTRA